jgi:hypothetical protein
METKHPAPIGAVFTPLNYAVETIIQTGLYERWQEGAVILDPTAGCGNFIEAFIFRAIEQGDPLTLRLLENLHAVEMQQHFIDQFMIRMKNEYAIDFPVQNFYNSDFLFFDSPLKADYIVGNPPWLNFCDLEDTYKEKIKHLFLDSGLAANKKDLLLGSSRIDIAALIISEAIRKNLKDRGNAYFYLPLSLFLNDGAHKGFRSLINRGNKFSLNYIYDYKNAQIFPDVSTRYGFASFTKGKTTSYPIDYFQFLDNKSFLKVKASPVGEINSPLIIYKANEKLKIPQISILKESKPRQGLNTCGANKLFIFDNMEKIDERLCRVAGKENSAILPLDLIFPLIGADQFKKDTKNRYVFLPYNSNGRVKSESELKQYPEAFSYLQMHKTTLCRRKGVLIQSSINKGLWWSLLGVGPYSFAPWKIVWEAYGKKDFKAKLFSSKEGRLWQPNQALQAFIPVGKKSDALKILKELNKPIVEEILRNQGMEGTCNWAQPGRMMKFLKIIDTH